ncbi:hypothetical protein [Microbulbifer sediminum]|uniref:hypothetical protein n=1 Tax=Microbulbifer sediminum TaxID=2904250 RepID=UPI001F2BF1F0|nr:hypothetical protein [Microbulbifer sediminum]
MRKNLALILLQSVLLCSAVLAEPFSPGFERADLSDQPQDDSQSAPVSNPDSDTDSLPPRSIGPVTATPISRAGTIARKIGRALPRARAGNAIRAPPLQA